MNAKRLLLSWLLGWLMGLSAGAALAAGQAVYRCGDQYTDQPCQGGTPVLAQDARSAEQQAQARARVQRESQLADSLEKRRLQEEARAAQAAQAAVPASSPPAAKPANPAQVKQTRRARWKVRRAPTVRPQPAVRPSHESAQISQQAQGVPGTELTTR